MGGRVDEPRRVVPQEQAEQKRNHYGADDVADQEADPQCQHYVDSDCPDAVVLMLRLEQFVGIQVLNDRFVDGLGLLEQPQHVRIPEAVLDAVRIEVSVHVLVVQAVVMGPLDDAALNGGSSEENQKPLDNRAGIVRAMRIEPVIAHCDAHERG